MDEPRQHDRGASLTDSVRQFRRVARLAAADPLRLLPLDALTRLASLSAPVTDLIDLAPFERLRHAVAAPPAAPRRESPRTRLQPILPTGHDVPARTMAAAAIAPAAQEVGRGAAAPAARRESSSSLAPARLAGEPLRPDTASASTLAERRAALRRRTIEAGSSAGPASHFVAEGAATTGSPSTPRSDAREIAGVARSRHVLDDETEDRARRTAPVPFDSVRFDRDSAGSAPNDSFASAATDRVTHHASLGDDARTASAPTDRSSDPVPLAAVGLPIGRDLPAAALRSGTDDPGSAAVSHAHSSPVTGRWPQAARTQADAGAAPRRRGWEPSSDPELADALFETLYRDGVDLPWP